MVYADRGSLPGLDDLPVVYLNEMLATHCRV
jgi:hypothetical protein